jgi:serine/threonine-protein kinase
VTAFSDHLQEALGSAYQLERELTGGGMSRVFVATDRALGRTVVVKVLPPELAAGVNRDRFRREIQLVSQLQHPHIVTLLSAGESGDLLWYTMPYIEGESLRAALERKREFSVREVCRILHDIVDALAYAHKRGVIHRDIKPANILTQGSHALVTDFGVAKALSAAMPISGVTSAGIAIGTPAYMAPEQLAGDPNADHRLDLYAVGLLAYELLTGESPFSGPSPRETMAAQLTRDPQPLHEIQPLVPAALSHLVMRLLAKDPNARPTTADSVLDELDALTSMPMQTTPQRGGIEAPKRAGRRTLLVALPLVAAAAVAVVVASRRDVSRDRTDPNVVPSDSIIGTTLGARGGPAAAAGGSGTGGAAAGTPNAGLVTATGPASQVVISREDSIRIAERVAQRVRASQLRDSVRKARLQDSLQKAMERRLIDSVIAANSGRTVVGASAPRRVAVIEPREIPTWPEAQLIARAVSDSIRRMLSRNRQFALVPQDSVRTYMAPRVRTRDSIPIALDTEMLIFIRLQPLPGDQSLLMLEMYDYGAARRTSRTISGRAGPRAATLETLDSMLLQALGTLNEMARMPRRGSAPSSSPLLPQTPFIPRPPA